MATDAENTTPHPPEAEEIDKGENPRFIEFYNIEASVVKAPARKLLREYGKIPDDQIDGWIDEIRREAFAIWPYPCIGMYRFLDLSLPTSPAYDEVLQRLKGGEKLLDLGCCFGHELRQLVFEGVPSENLYGSDLRAEFMDIGYKLFHDKDTLKSKFVAADVFDDKSALVELSNSFSIIYTGAFFHLFDYAEQIKVAKRVVQLLEDKPNTLVIGRQVGNDNAGEHTRGGYRGERTRYRHNEESWTKFWDDVGEQTGTKWQTQVVVDTPWEGLHEREFKLMTRRGENGARRLRYVVRRVE